MSESEKTARAATPIRRRVYVHPLLAKGPELAAVAAMPMKVSGSPP